MKMKTLQFAADRVSKTYTDHFEYWDGILFSEATALCFYLVDDTGLVSVITDPEKFPWFCTRPYIKRAIEAGAPCLGALHRGYITKNVRAKWLRYDKIA